ncbi:phospholipase D-like domain-containing protein [Bordetella genomosp. 11]|uniref:Cardiolipin synthase B n=1 Tax=Bordetella genomosp. 11 TaxID=1416808 RepID=A0A261UH98_9BORD|nr:phospholipase D-like domain-containing protein [Bordetella genomosp. 11]OZI61319.1 cardiolipin synthase B [Bordetella genomosp. 11]
MKRLWRACWLAAFACLLAACATVPDATEGTLPRSQIRIATDSGWLSYQRSQDVVKKLDAPGQPASGPRFSLDDMDPATAGFLLRHLQVEEAISGAPLEAGNRVDLFSDGPTTYHAMLEAIRGARQYVHMESYIFDDDDAGRKFADALIAKRKQGVPVALMVDGVGTLHTPKAFFDRLRDAGVQVVVFNPVNPAEARAGWSPNNRDHRKLLVVDGKTGFLGGINISSVYESSASGGSSASILRGSSSDSAQPPDPKEAPWRDTQIRVQGPAVAEIERVMQEGWQAQHGPPLDPREFYPANQRMGDLFVRIVSNRPGDRDGYTLYLTFMSAIQSAQRSIHITMAYFVPDPAFVQALADAARRNVDVVLVLPGFSDSSLVFHAGRSHYTELLEAGVKIYERRDAFLHAKTAVIDGVWSTVGSSNMDWRSFALNYELNAVVIGPRFARQMETLFAEDVARGQRIDAQSWSDRGVKERLMESFGRMFERWL